jgi:hypothetical protein
VARLTDQFPARLDSSWIVRRSEGRDPPSEAAATYDHPGVLKQGRRILDAVLDGR